MKRLQRVLHVEDVPSIQVVTRIALEKLGGYEVLSCASGQAALAEVQAFAPDLILLDMMLPQMTGLELLAQMSVLIDLRKTPVVLLTGQSDEAADPEELRRLGVRKLLHKPFNPLQLAAQLEDVWNAEHD
ncbi:response regulator [Stutzerimonas stutzeri]|jgi:two-component system, OmpR family, response regulator|uniref:Response regulator n=1 Tax=Stutzerimonas stutzeri TaxID=316 RepID=A0A2N8SS36_STUST|nr:response regulator [Stutzerimonas stutzeri]EQM79324.1 chemotaxis protein CheY [Stutzerimonas stutzeri MF28]MCI0917595.1 response regulator [Stutzerimonas stutzeri]MCQ4250380.1 response regulator [Stutzerimonas stutzeri]PNG05300.1 response regulator [Stutzerimonas stutzeri]QUE75861.1 response regulator [Stutzerimonas stutzeri]